MALVIAYDIGTTGIKTCLCEITEEIKILASASEGYKLYILEGGGAEQDTEEWWSAMCHTTKKVLEKSGRKPEEIEGISFCSQMQGLVLVDEQGEPVHRPMSYMDQRALDEYNKIMGTFPKLNGMNVIKTLKSLRMNAAASTSVKDPIWKYKWIETNEPENFKRAYKWLDVKEYFLLRCTGNFVMTKDSAYATFAYATKGKNLGWNDAFCKMYGIKREHLPEIIDCVDMAGELTEKSAAELGLVPGIPVFGGGGDATLIGIGAGCTTVGRTHAYAGTSGWVSTLVDKQYVDINYMIASTVGAEEGTYNYFAEMETAGKCLEWVKDHLALDEINIYLKKEHVEQSQESEYISLYDYLSDTIDTVPAGSNGVIFTPWLHGNRCPFEDPNAAGMFFNIKIDTGKTEMLRAVNEGVCYHLRWMLECQDKKINTSDVLRFVGGGALSDVNCQILADVTGRAVDTVSNTQDVGAVGAAACCGIGLGLIKNFQVLEDFIPIKSAFLPNEKNKAVYDKNFEVFKNLYKSNKKNFEKLNA